MDIGRYRDQIDRALASSEDTSFIVAVSTVEGEHRLGGKLGARLRKLHDLYSGLKGTRKAYVRELEALAKVSDAELKAASGAPATHKDSGPLTPALVTMHCEMCEGPVPAQNDDGTYWTALYGPAYLLGWTTLVGAERDLLTLPMTVGEKIDAKKLRKQAADAIERARHAYPALALDADDLDYTSPTHFAWSLTHAMYEAAASFDPTAKPKKAAKGKGKGKGKAAPRGGSPNMQALEERLLEATLDALRAWSKTNPGAELAQLGLDGTPPHDNVGICFDSAKNFAKTIASLAGEATKRRTALDYKHWELAHNAGSWLERFDVSYFDDHYRAEVKLPEYAAFARGAPAPKRDDGASWADGTLRVLFIRVLQRVVESGLLDEVRCAPMLYLGFTMHDEVPVVVHSIEQGAPMTASRKKR